MLKGITLGGAEFGRFEIIRFEFGGLEDCGRGGRVLLGLGGGNPDGECEGG
jgi:hypothetical protein